MSCILLNRTTRKQVDRVVRVLFDSWPTAEDMSRASADEVEEVVRSLGFKKRRAKALINMSREYSSGLDVERLSGVGSYALAAWRVFCESDVPKGAPNDHALKKYVEWRLNK